MAPAPAAPYPNPAAPGPISPPAPAPSGPPSWAPSSGPVPRPPDYQGNSGNWGGTPPGPPPHQPSGPTPWIQPQHQPPPRKRNPWPIVAGAAALVVLILAAAGIWFVTRPKPAPPPPDPISSDRLSGLLLSPSDINSVMGSSSMEPSKPITSMDTSGVTLSSPDCQGALYTSQEPVYAGTGYTGVSALVSAEPGDNNDHWVNQAVVLFPSAGKAKSFLENTNEKWKTCAGKTVTVTNKSKTYRWTFAQINGEPPKIAMLETQEAADGWECQRALSVANNVVVDINACGYKITDQGTQVADKIIAKVNAE
jgi:serine/threonine kinase PknH